MKTKTILLLAILLAITTSALPQSHGGSRKSEYQGGEITSLDRSHGTDVDYNSQQLSALTTTSAIEQRLHPGDLGAHEFFGDPSAMSGDTLVVGATGADDDKGAVYVFKKSGGAWLEQQRLMAADANAESRFAQAVAISGNTLVVGAPGDNHFSGAAYVFVRNGTVWSQQQKLVLANAPPFAFFGRSVAVVADTAVIGAPQAVTVTGDTPGAVYVWKRTGTIWSQQQELFAGESQSGDDVGQSVAFDGDSIVAGAPNTNLGGGCAYVFSKSGATFTQRQRLVPADCLLNDRFGILAAINNGTLVVTVDAAPDREAVYVFVNAGGSWVEQQKLVSPDNPPGFFGSSIAVDGGTAVIGASSETIGSNSEQGAAYVFARTGSVWSLLRKLTASDGAAIDKFGSSVAISGNSVQAGAEAANASQGAAYVFSFFDVFIKDDAGRLLRFNSVTGDYEFFDCRKGFSISGRGVVTIQSCKIDLSDIKSDRSLFARANSCTRVGNATLSVSAPSKTYTLSDSDITNNALSCP